MGFRCGIVGLPNVGKSTLYNALTAAGAEARNYPFCTIEPNTGVVPVPDARLAKIAAIARTRSADHIIPATMEFVDIAGLVAGASKGEGLGNKFLANIREMDAIAHVARCFEDDEIVHVAGAVNPVADVEIVNTELALADLETLDRVEKRASRRSNAGDRDARMEWDLARRIRAGLERGVPARAQDLTAQEWDIARAWCLLTAKPVLYVANLHEDQDDDAPALVAVKTLAAEEGAPCVTVCSKLEADLAELPADERAAFMRELRIEEPGLHRLIRAGYELLGLHTFFTAGEKETRAWTLTRGATAPQAAGVIHTDFQHGFIRAEVISYKEYVHYGGEQGAKEAGRLRLEGKPYVIRDGDVCHFRFNV